MIVKAHVNAFKSTGRCHVILARHLIPELNKGVSKVNSHITQLNEFIEYIADRAEDIDDEETINVEHALE